MPKFLALAIDDEFSGFDMIGSDLITIGATQVMDDFTLNGKSFYGEMRPSSPKYWTAKAEEKHGISYFKASQFPEPIEVLREFIKYLDDIDTDEAIRTIFYGSWNFDLRWIEVTMEKVGIRTEFYRLFKNAKEEHFNTLKMARTHLKHLEAHDLKTVSKYYNIKHTHHRADSDAMATAKIFCNIKNNINTWTGQLI